MAKDEFGTNKNNLFNSNDDTYIETLVINGKMVNVFSSDSGQCYWFQWLNDKGELESQTCGTYNFDYKEEIEYYFTPQIQKLSKELQDLRIKYIDLAREVSKMNIKNK